MSAFIFGIPPPGVQSEPEAAVTAPVSPGGPAKANPATKRGSEDTDTAESRKKQRGDPSAEEAARLQAMAEAAAEAAALARAEAQAAAEEDQRQAAVSAAEQARWIALEKEQRQISEAAATAAVERARAQAVAVAAASAIQVPSSPQDLEVQRLQQQLQQWRNLSNRAVPLEFDAAVERIQTQIWAIEEQLMRLGQQVPLAPIVQVAPVAPAVIGPRQPVAGQMPSGNAAAAASASSGAAASASTPAVRPKKPTKQALSPEGLSQTEMLELRAHLARQMFLDEQGKPLVDPQRTLAVRAFKPTGKARKKASIDPQFVQRQNVYMSRVRGEVEPHVLAIWAETALLPDTRRWLRQLLTYHANLTHAALVTAQKVNGPQFVWGTSFASHIDPLEIHVDRTEEECRARNKKKKFEYHALLCLPRNKPFYALLTANERDLADKIKAAGGVFKQPLEGDPESSGDEGNDANEEDQYATEDDEDVALAQFRIGGPATTPAAAAAVPKRPVTSGAAAAAAYGSPPSLVTAAVLAARQRAASTIVLSDDSDNDLPMPAAATSAASAESAGMND